MNVSGQSGLISGAGGIGGVVIVDDCGPTMTNVLKSNLKLQMSDDVQKFVYSCVFHKRFPVLH